MRGGIFHTFFTMVTPSEQKPRQTLKKSAHHLQLAAQRKRLAAARDGSLDCSNECEKTRPDIDNWPVAHQRVLTGVFVFNRYTITLCFVVCHLYALCICEFGRRFYSK